MGRYITGDIERKLWFGVQDSDDPSFFGGQESEPTGIDYYFDTDDVAKLKSGIAECNKELGKWKDKLDDFFNKNNGYNDDMLIEQTGIERDDIVHALTWYARLKLGEVILAKVEEQGDCSFNSEC